LSVGGDEADVSAQTNPVEAPMTLLNIPPVQYYTPAEDGSFETCPPEACNPSGACQKWRKHYSAALSMTLDERFECAAKLLSTLLECPAKPGELALKARLALGKLLLNGSRCEEALKTIPAEASLPKSMSALVPRAILLKAQANLSCGSASLGKQLFAKIIDGEYPENYKVEAYSALMQAAFVKDSYKEIQTLHNRFWRLFKDENGNPINEKKKRSQLTKNELLALEAQGMSLFYYSVAADRLSQRARFVDSAGFLLLSYQQTQGGALFESVYGGDIPGILLEYAKDSEEKLLSVVKALNWRNRSDIVFELFQKIVSEKNGSLLALSPPLADALAEAYLRGRRYEEAILFVSALLDMQPHYEKLEERLVMLAKAESRMGRADRAAAIYDKLYSQFGKSKKSDADESLFMAAFHEGKAGRFEKAAQTMDKLATSKTANGKTKAKAAWYRAWFAYKSKNYEKALSLFSALEKSSPKAKRQFAYWRARTLHQQGNIDAARTIYKELSDKTNLDYYFVLANQRLSAISDDEVSDKNSKNSKVGANGTIEGIKLAEKSIENSLPDLESFYESAQEIEQCPDLLPIRDSAALASAGFFDEARDAVKLFAEERRKAGNKFKFAAGKKSFGNAKPRQDFKEKADFKDKKKPKGSPKISAEKRKVSCDAEAFLQRFDLEQYLLAVRYYGEAFRRGFMLDVSGSDDDDEDSQTVSIPPFYAGLVSDASKKFGVPGVFAMSILHAESNFDAYATSPVGAQGLMQIMPYTAAKIAKYQTQTGFSASGLYDPAYNVGMGAWYLAALYRRFDGCVSLAAASYNAGPHNVSGWLTMDASQPLDEFVESIPFLETRNYVKKVIKYALRYKTAYKADFVFDDYALPPPAQTSNFPDF